MSAASPAVETFQLVKQFGGFAAVDHINLRVNRGSFFGFLGPNGAGKSTTIKMLTGLLAPTSGTLRVLDLDITAQPLEVKRRIGVVPEDLNLFERLTGAEMLSFTGRMYGLRPDEIAQRSPRTRSDANLSSREVPRVSTPIACAKSMSRQGPKKVA